MSLGMVTIDPGQEHLIVLLTGYALLTVLSIRLGLLGVRSRRHAGRPQSALWGYFTLAGVVGALVGSLGMLDIARLIESLTAPISAIIDPLLFAFGLLLALAMREAYYNATFANAEEDRLGSFRVRRSIEVLLVAIVPVTALGQAFVGWNGFGWLLGGGAILSAVYGAYYQRRRTVDKATRGTLIDTLLRQSLPALMFVTGAVGISVFGGLVFGAQLTETVAGIFRLLVAASLLPVTVKLNQHLLTRT